MENNIKGDEYLDYSDETLERQRNLRAVSLDHGSLMIRRVACFNGCIQLTVQTALRGYHVYREVWVPTVEENLIAGKKMISGRKGMQ